MLYVGLTGGIGSGKSTVSAILEELGARVIDADRLAREVVAPGTPGLAAVAARFGDQVLRPDGSLDRAVLGSIVFADAAARRDLEAITHPLVRELTTARRAEAPRDAIVVHDVPLLIETGLAAEHHLVVVADASEEIRLERLQRDRGLEPQTARARFAAQASDEQRRATADAVLDNSRDPEHLRAQVESLWRERLAPYEDNLLTGTGVRRSLPVSIVDPDPSWPDIAARDLARLDRQLALAGLRERVAGLDHIGSTSVPGLAAKDVVDLQVRVDDLELATDERFVRALAAAGFVGGRPHEDTVHPWDPDPAHWAKWLWYGADPAVVRHLHVRAAARPGARAALTFRDWLRAHPAEAAAYEAEKRRAAHASPGTDATARADYTAAKEPWIAAALTRARAWDARSTPR